MILYQTGVKLIPHTFFLFLIKLFLKSILFLNPSTCMKKFLVETTVHLRKIMIEFDKNWSIYGVRRTFSKLLIPCIDCCFEVISYHQYGVDDNWLKGLKLLRVEHFKYFQEQRNSIFYGDVTQNTISYTNSKSFKFDDGKQTPLNKLF